MLYHVTYTKKIPAIRENGLLTQQTSNWVKQGNKERYGQGEVYAFESLEDAIRWAARMDWELNTELGSGKISIIEIEDTDDWEVDSNDPLSQLGSRGNWLKRETYVAPEDLGDDMVVTANIIRENSKVDEAVSMLLGENSSTG